MAFNVITPTNSLTDAQLYDDDGSAFLLVTEGAYITLGLVNAPAYITRGGSGSITVKGSIISQSSYGIDAEASTSNAFAVGYNTVTITSSGYIQGTDAVRLFGDANIINNDGMIAGTTASGSGISLAGAANTVDNSGTIKGYQGVLAIGSLFLQNTGTISGLGFSIRATDTAQVYNTGTMSGDILIFDQGFISNTGVIDGAIKTSYSVDSGSEIHNSGTITGKVQTSATSFYVQSDYVYNDGRMAEIELGKGNDLVENHAGGTIAGIVHLDDSFGGSGQDDDILDNGGTIIGNVYGGDGDDAVDTETGVIVGLVDLGAGNDTYTGGDSADRVVGGAGADTIDLGGGNDQYRAVNADGKDDIDGGDGNDTYNASACTLSVGVDLSAATSSLTVGNDLILNFENIIGGSANDTLTGSDDGNRIDGGAGSDILGGGDGNDRILGGAGTDTITGGLGRDVLTGGTATGLNEADKFVFSDGDSGTKASTRDVITDFTNHGSASAPFATGADTIDLHLIDANTVAAANQAFSFNSVSGAAFSGVAGSLIWLQTGQFALVLGDTDGDSKADFVIQLNGVHALLASDFVL